jgi:hypothetical protein
MQIRTLLNVYRCDACGTDCKRSQLGTMVSIRDVKPMIKDEKVSITKHYCNDCTGTILSYLGVK